MRSKTQARVAVTVGAMALSMIGTSFVHGQDAVTINYGLWDANQLPAYQQCATAFQAKNPNITIKITQQGWSDYWTGISTGFASGSAPDVFTDHLAKYPEFVKQNQLMDIQPMVDADKVPTDNYYPGLADLWSKDGKRYGLPKDWDTVATVYNADMLKAAGIDPKVFDTWSWNPTDGGTFEQTIAKLTLDKNGKNGLDPAFDKANVVQYGFVFNGLNDAYGQTTWSPFAVSNGFVFNNGLWGNKYNYDDPNLAATIQYLANLWLKKGYSPDEAAQTSLGNAALFQSKKAAITLDGSWMIGTYVGSTFPVGFGRLPAGPQGRKSMFNGLADSIWVGTQHPKEAWAWVKFLSSADCEDLIGKSGVVFPAIPEAAQLSFKARQDKNVDVSAFLDQANEKGGTFVFPITDNGAQIAQIMSDTMTNIANGKADAASALKAANAQVNALFN
jgi:multiple sugar transport system substrate-binding protein